VDETPDSRFLRKPGDPCCGFDVNGMERLWPAFPIEAHGINDAHDTCDGSGDGAIVINVRLDRVELNVGEKRCNAFWMPRRYPHGEMILKQVLDNTLPEKASPAEDGHLPWCHRHVRRGTVLNFGL
jgi:hypothetical protein